MHGVQPEELPSVFPLINQLLMKIPRLGEKFGLPDIYAELETGAWQLWIAGEEQIDAVMLTTVIKFPRTTELHLLGVAGSRMRDWLPFLPLMKEFARKSGCKRIVMGPVRQGFKRALPEFKGNRIHLELTL